jgi:hypothetical protein
MPPRVSFRCGRAGGYALFDSTHRRYHPHRTTCQQTASSSPSYPLRVHVRLFTSRTTVSAMGEVSDLRHAAESPHLASTKDPLRKSLPRTRSLGTVVGGMTVRTAGTSSTMARLPPRRSSVTDLGPPLIASMFSKDLSQSLRQVPKSDHCHR